MKNVVKCVNNLLVVVENTRNVPYNQQIGVLIRFLTAERCMLKTLCRLALIDGANI